MKKFAASIVLALLTFHSALPQSPCLPKGKTFTTQAQIDNIVRFSRSLESCEDFDDLVAGEYVVEQLGGSWICWNGLPGSMDAIVVNDNSNSLPNSFRLDNSANIVYLLGNEAYISDAWEYSHYMYVPSGVPGYFNVQEDPEPGVGWLLEMYFNENNTGNFAGSSSATFTYETDTWFMVKVLFDLDNNLGQVWFDNVIIEEFDLPGSIGGINYWGNNSYGDTGAYFDDVCFGEGAPVQQLPPPADLEVSSYNNEDIVLSWNAPTNEKNSIKTIQSTEFLVPEIVDKDPDAKQSNIPSDDMFDLLFNFTPQGDGEAGIEIVGEYLYTASWNGSGLYKYDQLGNLADTISMAGLMIRDMACNGIYLYASAASTTVYEFDPVTGMLVSSFTSPTNVRGIAYDEEEDVFYANNWSDDIVKFDMSGANLGSFPVGPLGGSYYGLAIENPDDEIYLWGYGQTGANLNELVQIELPLGIETGVYFDVGSLINPGGMGIAGGLASDGNFVPEHFTLIGCMQAVSLWGLELDGPNNLTGYNIYYSDDGSFFDFLDFSTDTFYTHENVIGGADCYFITALYESGESAPSNTDCYYVVSSAEERAVSQISIFPNPSSDFVSVRSTDPIKNLVMYNMNGLSIKNESLNNREYHVNVKGINPGVYLIRIDTDKGSSLHRVVIE